jgi:hypothetical protein
VTAQHLAAFDGKALTGTAVGDGCFRTGTCDLTVSEN